LDLVPVPVDESEIRFLTDARELVLAALAHHGITIEMNPSSNLIIADLPGFERHPARLFRSVDRDGARVGVTIADDDPITFATNLRDEHAYAYAHVRTAGCSVEDAVAWVRDAMRAGMAARFSLGWRLGEPEGVRERGASGAPHGAERADRRRAGP
jgi:adenosine deaminase